MYVEMGGNLVPVSKTGEQLRLVFRSFHDNRLSFIVRLRDPVATEEPVGRLVLMREPKSAAAGRAPPACTLNFTLPDVVAVCGDETVTSDSRSEDDRTTTDELRSSSTRLTDTAATGNSPATQHDVGSAAKVNERPKYFGNRPHRLAAASGFVRF